MLVILSCISILTYAAYVLVGYLVCIYYHLPARINYAWMGDVAEKIIEKAAEESAIQSPIMVRRSVDQISRTQMSAVLRWDEMIDETVDEMIDEVADETQDGMTDETQDMSQEILQTWPQNSQEIGLDDISQTYREPRPTSGHQDIIKHVTKSDFLRECADISRAAREMQREKAHKKFANLECTNMPMIVSQLMTVRRSRKSRKSARQSGRHIHRGQEIVSCE